jgi:protocatechuate 4,5-dioxygenase alpha chain
MSRNWVHAIPSPEAYWINRVLYDTQHKPSEMARFQADPAAYLQDLPLSEAAKGRLATNAIGPLYVAGANPYLLRAHCLHLRVPEADYLGALRAVAEEPGLG